MRPCVFCGSAARLTDEDALPAWVRRTLEIRGPVTASAIDDPDGPRRPVGRPMAALKVILAKSLCHACNNAWLGGTIEEPASRLLKPMIVATHPVTLTISDQELLAFWAMKTAFVLEMGIRELHQGERAVEGYVPSQVELAYMWRYSKPPPRSMAWIGAYDCQSSKPLAFEPSGAALPTDDGAPVAGHLTTFSVGYVAFQVFTVDFLAAEQHGADVWNTHVPGSLAGHLDRIWPQLLGARSVTWPKTPFRADEWRRVITWDGVLRPPELAAS